MSSRTTEGSDGNDRRCPTAWDAWIAFLGAVVALVVGIVVGPGARAPVRAVAAVLLISSMPLIFAPFVVLRRHGAVARGAAYYETSQVVERGPYAVVRHPQYLGYAVLVLGFVLLSQHPLVALPGLVAVAALRMHAMREERQCLERLGGAYRDYMRRVPRFNLPLGVMRLMRRKREPAVGGVDGLCDGRTRRTLSSSAPARTDSMTDDNAPSAVPDPRRAARQIPEVDRRALLRLARRSILDYLEHGAYPEIPTGSGAMLVPRAAFVTLRDRATRELRGCVGQVSVKGPLAQAVMHMAVAAATQDPRFPPIGREELPQLSIEISALGAMEPIAANRIEVGRHGLLLRSRGRTGLLLPGVAVEHGWSRDELLTGLCRKAGVHDGAWLDPDAELLAFETERWEETE